MATEFFLRFVTAVFLVILFIGVYVYAPAMVISLLLLSMLALVLVLEWPRFRLPYLTPVYPIVPFVLLIILNQSMYRSLLALVCVGVFSFDTGAYIFGKLGGRHKLAPRISPGKSWEGVCGGYVTSCLVVSLFLYVTGRPVIVLGVALFCFVTSLADTAGDLFESYLKRRVHLKDSGNLLPGHGGLLDRFDGLLGAVVLVYPFRAYFASLLGLSI